MLEWLKDTKEYFDKKVYFIGTDFKVHFSYIQGLSVRVGDDLTFVDFTLTEDGAEYYYNPYFPIESLYETEDEANAGLIKELEKKIASVTKDIEEDNKYKSRLEKQLLQLTKKENQNG